MRALRLDRVALNVAGLAESARFYVEALGFTIAGAEASDPGLARLMGIRTVRALHLTRGGQTLELTQIDPPGAPYPAGSASNDLWFQHCALVTTDVREAHARLAGQATTPISRHGPQVLPGGIVAYKFRDPDGHPLELISFPEPDSQTAGGIDHSAISVGDAGRSIAFYADLLGLSVGARQVNTGPAQDALDDLERVLVDVVALQAQAPAPHLELLGYRTPPGRPAPRGGWSDLAASRLVFTVDRLERDQQGVSGTRLVRDPDGHALLLEGPSVSPR